MPCLHGEEKGAPIFAANLLARKLRVVLKFAPSEGRKPVRELSGGEVCSPMGFCLRRTTYMALQPAGQMGYQQNKGCVEEYNSIQPSFRAYAT